MTIEKPPKWYSNLKAWREENGCTGELWELYVAAIQEKLRQYKYAFFICGVLTGVFLSWIYVYLRS